MSISGIGVSDSPAPWEKRKTQRSITGTDFAGRMADINRSNTVRQASGTTNGRKAIFGAASGRDLYVNDSSDICGAQLWDAELSKHQDKRLLLRDKANIPADEQDSNTHSEIIVRPDGSRVLVITMDIAGTQTAMSLQISEPTDMQNDVSRRKDGGDETDNATVLTSDEISGSFSEE